jgi:hypothetical protein
MPSLERLRLKEKKRTRRLALWNQCPLCSHLPSTRTHAVGSALDPTHQQHRFSKLSWLKSCGGESSDAQIQGAGHAHHHPGQDPIFGLYSSRHYHWGLCQHLHSPSLFRTGCRRGTCGRQSHLWPWPRRPHRRTSTPLVVLVLPVLCGMANGPSLASKVSSSFGAKSILTVCLAHRPMGESPG